MHSHTRSHAYCSRDLTATICTQPRLHSACSESLHRSPGCYGSPRWTEWHAPAGRQYSDKIQRKRAYSGLQRINLTRKYGDDPAFRFGDPGFLFDPGTTHNTLGDLSRTVTEFELWNFMASGHQKSENIPSPKKGFLQLHSSEFFLNFHGQ